MSDMAISLAKGFVLYLLTINVAIGPAIAASIAIIAIIIIARLVIDLIIYVNRFRTSDIITWILSLSMKMEESLIWYMISSIIL